MSEKKYTERYYGLPTRKQIWSDTAPQVVRNLAKMTASNTWDKIKTISATLGLGGIMIESKTL